LRKIITNTILLLSSVFFIISILEIYFTIFSPYKIVDQFTNNQYHPIMGWSNVPNLEGQTKLWNKSDGIVYRKHNNKGMRCSKEITYEKPPGVKRIILIGDSFFWGFGVSNSEVVSEVLQQMVGNKIEIINGAVTGYGTDQELLWLINEGIKYKPDLVICGFFPANDLEDITASLRHGHPKPYYTLENGSLSLNNVPVPDLRELRTKYLDNPDSYFKKTKKLLRHNLHTYQFVTGKLNSIPRLRSFLLRAGIVEDRSAIYKRIPLYNQPDRFEMQILFEALITEMKRVCELNGSRFLLFFIPTKEQEPNSPTNYEDCDRFTNDNCIIDLGFDENSANTVYLQRVTARDHISYLDFLPVVRKNHREGKLLYYRGTEDHHWSTLGHRAAAEAIYSYLKGIQLSRN